MNCPRCHTPIPLEACFAAADAGTLSAGADSQGSLTTRSEGSFCCSGCGVRVSVALHMFWSGP